MVDLYLDLSLDYFNRIKMKVLLIAPPIRENLFSGLDDGMPKKVAKEFGIYPHLGICYIAAVLRKNNIEVEIIDIEAERLSKSQVITKVREIDPDIIGITSMTFTFLYALDLAKEIKLNLSVPIVFGGNHVSIYPKEAISHDSIDIVVIGEGENTFLEIVQMLGDKKLDDSYDEMKKIKGIAFKNKSDIFLTEPREFISNLDEIPPPAVDRLKIGNYYGCNLPIPFLTMITARGCPYNCFFCSRAPWGRTFQYHSAKRVVDEIEYLVNELGIKAIEFFDDTFVFNQDRIKEMSELIKEKRIHFEFGITTRVNNINTEILRELKTMGCKTIAFGVESGDPGILNKLDKRITVGLIKDAFRWSKEAGINTVGFFMVGNPTETKDEIKNTIDLIKEIDADYFIANILMPYPGSRLYSDMLTNGRLREDYWRRVTLEGKASPTPLANDTIPRKKLIQIRNRINRMPYLRLKSNLFKFKKVKLLPDIKRALITLITSYFDNDL